MSGRLSEDSAARSRRMDVIGLSGAMAFLRGVFGSAVMLIGAKGIEILFFGSGFYAVLAQHPFWIIVLLAALLEGLYVGVATAALAALLMDWPPRPLGVDITAHYIDVAILPLQWLMAAICLGAYRQIELRRQSETELRNDELHRVNDALADEVARLDSAVHAMELAAVTRDQDEIRQGAQRLVALQLAPREELPARFTEAVAALTDWPCALLLLDKDKLVQFAGSEIEGLDLPFGSPSQAFEAIDMSRGGMRLPLTVPDDPDAAFAAAAIRGPGGHLVGAVILCAGSSEEAEAETGSLSFLAAILGRAVSGGADVVTNPFARGNTLSVVGAKID